MKTPQRILVPYDFSVASRIAFDYAVVLARRFGASIAAVHAVDSWLLPLETECLMNKARAKLHALVAEVPDVVAHAIVLPEGPVVAVETAGADFAADLLVMSTHGRSALARALIGNVAAQILRGSKIDVIAIPPGATDCDLTRAPRHLLVATDFRNEARVALDVAADLARCLDAKVMIVHAYAADHARNHAADAAELVANHEHDCLRRLKTEAVRAGLDARTTADLARDDPARAIVASAARTGADLIVLGARHRSPIEHAVHRGTREHVIRTARCPVLIVHASSARLRNCEIVDAATI